MLAGFLSEYWGVATFAALFFGGNVSMSRTKSWTKPHHHALVIMSSLPLFASMLASGPLDRGSVFIVVVGWLAAVVPVIVIVQQMPWSKIPEDHDLRWDLRGKRK